MEISQNDNKITNDEASCCCSKFYLKRIKENIQIAWKNGYQEQN